jgi:hypothetical protein
MFSKATGHFAPLYKINIPLLPHYRYPADTPEWVQRGNLEEFNRELASDERRNDNLERLILATYFTLDSALDVEVINYCFDNLHGAQHEHPNRQATIDYVTQRITDLWSEARGITVEPGQLRHFITLVLGSEQSPSLLEHFNDFKACMKFYLTMNGIIRAAVA